MVSKMLSGKFYKFLFRVILKRLRENATRVMIGQFV